jgi:hypothetical protein
MPTVTPPLTPALLRQIEERMSRPSTTASSRIHLQAMLRDARGDLRTVLEHVKRLGETELHQSQPSQPNKENANGNARQR